MGHTRGYPCGSNGQNRSKKLLVHEGTRVRIQEQSLYVCLAFPCDLEYITPVIKFAMSVRTLITLIAKNMDLSLLMPQGIKSRVYLLRSEKIRLSYSGHIIDVGPDIQGEVATVIQ